VAKPRGREPVLTQRSKGVFHRIKDVKPRAPKEQVGREKSIRARPEGGSDDLFSLGERKTPKRKKGIRGKGGTHFSVRPEERMPHKRSRETWRQRFSAKTARSKVSGQRWDKILWERRGYCERAVWGMDSVLRLTVGNGAGADYCT